MLKIIFSVATYPKRFNYLCRALKSILSQTIFDKVDTLYINVDDNLTQTDYSLYKTLEILNSKIHINICPAKWKSANKLISVYEKHHDDIIICFDDDKYYPEQCAEQLLSEYKQHPNCIIAQEINPSVFINGQLIYLNAIDVKLGQEEFGKYLSNGCLFCPNCFDKILFDFDSFQYVTEGHHDELWFWIASTLKGIKCVGLANTWSYEADGICFATTDSDLTNINAKQDVVNGYNKRLNEKFGAKLAEIINNNTVDFVAVSSTVYGLLRSIPIINNIYNGFRIKIILKDLPYSWDIAFKQAAQRMPWREFNIEHINSTDTTISCLKKCCICAIAKDEDNYINEWIDYHLKLGIDDIYIFENNWRYRGRPYGCNVHFVPFDGEARQLSAYNMFIDVCSNEYQFGFFIDCDEFICLKKHSNISEFLDEYFDVDAIALNWRCFGDNGFKKVENNNYSLLERFTKCENRLNKHIKTCINFRKSGNKYHFVNPHFIDGAVSGDITINLEKTRYIHGPFDPLEEYSDIAQLNHYNAKTFEEFSKKFTRGKADTPMSHPKYNYTHENFEEHNCNDVEDLTARNFYFKKS